MPADGPRSSRIWPLERRRERRNGGFSGSDPSGEGAWDDGNTYTAADPFTYEMGADWSIKFRLIKSDFVTRVDFKVGGGAWEGNVTQRGSIAAEINAQIKAGIFQKVGSRRPRAESSPPDETDTPVKEGDTVLYGKYSGTELQFEGKDYMIMRESDILAVL